MTQETQKPQLNIPVVSDWFSYPPATNGRYMFRFEVKDGRFFEINAFYAAAIGIIREKQHGEILWIPSNDFDIIGWKHLN